jgi:colanic acid biosynthesis protein WcaH
MSSRFFGWCCRVLAADSFLRVVAATPLVAVDLVVVRGSSEVLLGLRRNRPAQGTWFVPGGRIRKNEPMQSALARVAAEELGLQLADLPQAPEPMGAFEHFYRDSFAGAADDVGVSTHYVVLGHLIRVPAGFGLPACDAQHDGLRWWPLAEAMSSDLVHRFTKDYVARLLLPDERAP